MSHRFVSSLKRQSHRFKIPFKKKVSYEEMSELVEDPVSPVPPLIPRPVTPITAPSTAEPSPGFDGDIDCASIESNSSIAWTRESRLSHRFDDDICPTWCIRISSQVNRIKAWIRNVAGCN